MSNVVEFKGMNAVTFKYFQTETGSTIITYGNFPRNARKSFPDVNLQKYNALAQAHNLSGLGKVKLLLKLQHIKGVYAIGHATDSVSADTAVARWIGGIEKSIRRIKTASFDGDPKFVEALDAMAAIADEWAKSKIANDENDIALSELGFDTYRNQEFVSYGTHQFIRKWFSQAKLIEEFAKGARKKLIETNRPRDRLTFGISKEALLFGHQLPQLYEQVTKRKFGISKQDDQTVQRTTGVAFVLDCTEAIGLQPVSPATVAWHWKNIATSAG